MEKYFCRGSDESYIKSNDINKKSSGNEEKIKTERKSKINILLSKFKENNISTVPNSEEQYLTVLSNLHIDYHSEISELIDSVDCDIISRNMVADKNDDFNYCDNDNDSYIFSNKFSFLKNNLEGKYISLNKKAYQSVINYDLNLDPDENINDNENDHNIYDDTASKIIVIGEIKNLVAKRCFK